MRITVALVNLLIVICVVDTHQNSQNSDQAQNLSRNIFRGVNRFKNPSKIYARTSTDVEKTTGLATSSDYADNDRVDHEFRESKLNEIPGSIKWLQSGHHNGIYQDGPGTSQDVYLSGLEEFDQTISQPFHQQQAAADMDTASRGVPPFMMNLYMKLANDRHVYPEADIVRSFINEENDPDVGSGFGTENGLKLEDQQRTDVDHSLLFNVTIPIRESIIMAYLRMFILVSNVNTYRGGFAHFTIYHDCGAQLQLVTSRMVSKQNNGWENFDLTDFIRLVLRRNHLKASEKKSLGVRSQPLRLKIHLEAVMGMDGRASLDVDISHDIEFEPLLLIYSDDYANLIQQENSLEMQGEHAIDRMNKQMHSSMHKPHEINSATTVRGKRNAVRRNLCRRWPMQVVFKDIGWDEWVVAPRHYEAFKCSGKCVFPLSDHWNPTLHSIIQTLAHEYDPARVENPCCVPTQLSPISLLYLDEANVLTYKYRYEGMVVSKCGCH